MKHAMFLASGPYDEMIAWAKKYESASFDPLWQAELTNSALIQPAAIAPSVGSIKICSGVALAFNHSPVMAAFQAIDPDFLSQGKFILGLGVVHQNRNNNWYAGRDEGKPVSQMREYIEVLQLIIDKAPRAGRSTIKASSTIFTPAISLPVQPRSHVHECPSILPRSNHVWPP